MNWEEENSIWNTVEKGKRILKRVRKVKVQCPFTERSDEPLGTRRAWGGQMSVASPSAQNQGNFS